MVKITRKRSITVRKIINFALKHDSIVIQNYHWSTDFHPNTAAAVAAANKLLIHLCIVVEVFKL